MRSTWVGLIYVVCSQQLFPAVQSGRSLTSLLVRISRIAPASIKRSHLHPERCSTHHSPVSSVNTTHTHTLNVINSSALQAVDRQLYCSNTHRLSTAHSIAKTSVCGPDHGHSSHAPATDLCCLDGLRLRSHFN